MNILTGIYLVLSLAFNGANVPTKEFDYSVNVILYKPSVFHVDVERLRQAGKEFLNSDIYYNYRYKAFSTSLRWLHNSGRDIDIYQSDVRWHFTKHLNVGGAIVWQNGIPERKMVCGANHLTRIKFFLLPLTIEARSDVYTGDFKKYSHAEKVVVVLDVISLLGLYFDLSIEDFDLIDWSMTAGLKVNL